MAKNGEWQRLPPFIWGDGAKNGRVGAEYTETHYLLHTRAPRFLCDYGLRDDRLDEAVAAGAGADLCIEAGFFLFRRFVFLDAPPPEGQLVKLCAKAALMREQLDWGDMVAGEETLKGEIAAALAKRDEDAAAEVTAAPASAEPAATFDPRPFVAAHPNEVREAVTRWFPAQWQRHWQTTAQASGERISAHPAGMVVYASGQGAKIEVTRWHPREQRRQLRAQALALANATVPESAAAQVLHTEAQERERAQAVAQRLCAGCRDAYRRSLADWFPPEWAERWQVAANGRGARREDGCEIRVVEEAALWPGVGLKIEPPKAGQRAWSADERLAIMMQALALLTDEIPEVIALGRTPHHTGAALPSCAIPFVRSTPAADSFAVPTGGERVLH